MPVMSPIPPDHPLMKAWTAYEQTEDFKNTLGHATKHIIISTAETAPEANRVNLHDERETRARGALWAAFMAGFKAKEEFIENYIANGKST